MVFVAGLWDCHPRILHEDMVPGLQVGRPWALCFCIEMHFSTTEGLQMGPRSTNTWPSEAKNEVLGKQETDQQAMTMILSRPVPT